MDALVALATVAVEVPGALHALLIVPVAMGRFGGTVAVVFADPTRFGSRVRASVTEEVDAAVLLGVAARDPANGQCYR